MKFLLEFRHFRSAHPILSWGQVSVFCAALITFSACYSFAQTSPASVPGATASPTESPGATPASWFIQTEILPDSSNGLKMLNIGSAVLIGFLGAAAFYAGVRFGFISNESREQLLTFIKHPPNPRNERLFFYFFGGIVAGVFQWAQPDVLAPIQAFVLGATWPSVVTRIMSGSTPGVPSASSIVNATPPTLPGEKKTVEEAIVVVPSPHKPEMTTVDNKPSSENQPKS